MARIVPAISLVALICLTGCGSTAPSVSPLDGDATVVEEEKGKTAQRTPSPDEPAPPPAERLTRQPAITRGEPGRSQEVIMDMPAPQATTGSGMGDMVTSVSHSTPSSSDTRSVPRRRVAKDRADRSLDDFDAGGQNRWTPRDPPAPRAKEALTESYTDYGVNGFDLTTRDNLSTFAVDVDTASYTITRRKLTEGYLPPTSAVRVEEFVNYFPYEYSQPKPGDPFAVDMEASPSPYNPTNHIVRVGVQGKKVAFDSRKPVHLTFLVDVSGSMQSRDKIGMLKDSLKMLTNELEDGDTVAIATYAGATKIVLRPTPMSRKADIIRALDGLNAGGSTAMGAGIDLAYGLADASYRDGAVNRVIVCSDGDANVGQTSHSVLSTKIKGYANKGITLTTIGFGNGNYNDTMMERLANDGDGNYFYIDSLKESRRIFVDKLSSTLEVIAKDVKIQVEWNKDTVLAYRLIGYENRDVADHDFRNDAVDAGEIGAGHQVTALFEVALADNPVGSLGTVRIRNKAPGPEAPAVERSYNLPASAIRSSFAASSAQLRLQVASAGFAEILRGSPHMNEISLRQVADIARGAQRVEYDEDAELVRLIERASQLKGERAMVSR